MSQKGQQEIMDCDTDVKDGFISAVREGNLERVNQLIDSFGLSYYKEWLEGYTLLNEALCYHQPAVAKLLLNKVSRVNSTKFTGYSPLHFAVQSRNYNSIKIAEMVLNEGANIYAKDKDGKTPLYYAIKKNKIKFTELLLKYGYDINTKVTDDTFLIHEAAKKGSLPIIEYLINNGANFNYRCSKYNYSPLHYAVDIGNKEITLFLLNRGAYVDLIGKNCMTPLHIAAQRGHIHIVESLLNRGACVNSLTLEEEYTPLHFACASIESDGAIAILLLNSGADVNASTKINLTPLHIATNNRKDKVVKLLLQYGADVDYQDENSNTVLYQAAEMGCIEIVQGILEYSPDINNESNRKSLKAALLFRAGIRTYSYYKIIEALLKYGFTIYPEDAYNVKLLHGAVEKGYLKIVEELLKYGADFHASDENGRISLHFTALCKFLSPYYKEVQDYELNVGKIANLLLHKGINVNSRTHSGETTLHFASSNGYKEVVKVLLEFGANVNSKDENSWTPLHKSFERKNELISIILLENGADVNAKTKDRVSPLHVAAQRFSKMPNYTKSRGTCINYPEPPRYQAMAELILKGADIDSRDDDGRTALHIASYNRLSKKVEILLENGSDINIVCKNNHTPLDYALKIDGSFSHKYFYEVGKVLSDHLVKMMAANMYVSKKNVESLRRCNKTKDIHDKCKEEIARMKTEKINNTNISFYDILAKCRSSLVMYTMRNKNIVEVLKSDNYKIRFPLYTCLIKSSFKQCMERKELLEKGCEFFHFLFSNLPLLTQECTDHIFSYFTNQELKSLLECNKYNRCKNVINVY